MRILLVWMMRFWESIILVQNDLVAWGCKLPLAQSSFTSTQFSFSLMTNRILNMEEMNQVMRWTRTWPYLVFLLPPTILLCVITELAAGSNQQRCAEPGSNERAMSAARDAVLTHSFHPIPNTHPSGDREKKHTAMFYSLYKNWGTQGLITEALQITDEEWKITVIQRSPASVCRGVSCISFPAALGSPGVSGL